MTTLAKEVKVMRLANLDKNIRHCWRCSHCKWVPAPKSLAFAAACPSIEYGGFHPYSGGGKVITAHALESGEAAITPAVLDSIYACSMCGACDTACKSNNGELIEPLGILYALRAHVVEQGRALPEHVAKVRQMREQGNAVGRPRTERSRWAAGLGLRDATQEPVEVLLHIGCENAFDEAQWPELRAIVGLLTRAGVDFGIAYDAESATGEAAWDLGFQDDARALAAAMAGVIDASGVKSVVTCSAASYHGFVNVWARMGLVLDVPVQHVTAFVDGLIDAGRLAVEGRFDATVTYHDPCKLGRLGETFTPSDAVWTTVLQTVSHPDRPTHTLFGNAGVYEPPRRLLGRLGGLKLVEMERNRVASYCCGAAGGAQEGAPEFAEFAAQKRLGEAAATGATVVATACGSCRRHLGDVAGRHGGPRVMGVFEILAAAAAAGPAA